MASSYPLDNDPESFTQIEGTLTGIAWTGNHRVTSDGPYGPAVYELDLEGGPFTGTLNLPLPLMGKLMGGEPTPDGDGFTVGPNTRPPRLRVTMSFEIEDQP